jgi:hypothetical protein
MQEYINQLLEDIVAAHGQPEEKITDDKPLSIEEHFEEIERWLESDPEYTFAYYCGLEPEQFPPAARLTDEQLETVYKAYEQLLFSWNLNADIPELFPLRRAYPLLISTLHHKVEIENDDFTIIEFCSCAPAHCPFEEFCLCKEYETNPDEKIMDQGEENDEFPF